MTDDQSHSNPTRFVMGSESRPESSSPPEPAREASPAPRTDDASLAPLLGRVESQLQRIAGRLEAEERARQFHDFSMARLIGVFLQLLVLGFVVAALVDWRFDNPEARQLVKLAFAGVLQIAALTSFVVAREKR